MKKEIHKIRLKTQISDCYESATKSMYAKQKAAAIEHLKMLQEEYKQITGEYLENCVIKENALEDGWETLFTSAKNDLVKITSMIIDMKEKLPTDLVQATQEIKNKHGI